MIFAYCAIVYTIMAQWAAIVALLHEAYPWALYTGERDYAMHKISRLRIEKELCKVFAPGYVHAGRISKSDYPDEDRAWWFEPFCGNAMWLGYTAKEAIARIKKAV